MVLLLALGLAGALKTGAPVVDPCANLECPPLKTYPGRCCPYCESTVVIKDDKSYAEEASKAYAAYKTAPYAGGR